MPQLGLSSRGGSRSIAVAQSQMGVYHYGRLSRNEKCIYPGLFFLPEMVIYFTVTSIGEREHTTTDGLGVNSYGLL